MSLHLQPHKFDLNRIKEGATCILVAKRRSGKSVAIKELIHHFDVNCGIKAGVICSHSEESDPYYSKFFHDTFIFDNCEKMLRKVIERQKKIKDDNKKLIKEGKPIKDPRILVILDDVIDDPSFIKSKDFNDIMFNGRHDGITLIIAVQYIMALPPKARGNFDYAFLFANDTYKEIKNMYESFAGIFPSEKIFKVILNEFTVNYNILVIDRTNDAHASINDKYGIFRANINLKYDKFGGKELNKYHKIHYDSEWNETNKTGIIIGKNNKDIEILH